MRGVTRESYSSDFEYSVRGSERARSVRVRISVTGDVEVVVPAGFDRSRIPSIVARHEPSIAAARARIHAQRLAVGTADDTSAPPARLLLRALDEDWTIAWTHDPARPARLALAGTGRLHAVADVESLDSWAGALRAWLVDRAKHRLIPWTEERADRLAMPVSTVRVRCQRSRWGSYSIRGTLSLNAQLLFLPRRLAEYVIVHELCHTVHLDHSPAFWRLVAAHVPHADALRAEMRSAWSYVPSWIAARR